MNTFALLNQECCFVLIPDGQQCCLGMSISHSLVNKIQWQFFGLASLVLLLVSMCIFLIIVLHIWLKRQTRNFARVEILGRIRNSHAGRYAELFFSNFSSTENNTSRSLAKSPATNNCSANNEASEYYKKDNFKKVDEAKEPFSHINFGTTLFLLATTHRGASLTVVSHCNNPILSSLLLIHSILRCLSCLHYSYVLLK